MVAGQLVRVRLNRDYGRFEEKPCLARGEHHATVVLPRIPDEGELSLKEKGWNEVGLNHMFGQTHGFGIQRGGHNYYVEPRDVEVLEVIA